MLSRWELGSRMEYKQIMPESGIHYPDAKADGLQIRSIVITFKGAA